MSILGVNQCNSLGSETYPYLSDFDINLILDREEKYFTDKSAVSIEQSMITGNVGMLFLACPHKLV